VRLTRCQRANRTKYESTQAKTTQTFMRQALGALLGSPDAQGPARPAVKGQIEN
jgi:hypothetical protein